MYSFKIEMVVRTKYPNGYIVSGDYVGDVPKKGAMLITKDGEKYIFIATEVRRFNIIMIDPVNENDVPKEGTTLFLEENTK